MHRDTIEAITRSAAIPSMPLVATRCFELTQDPLCSYEKLVELLGTDPGIAAEILRLANSAMFGVVRQVNSLKHAVALLGLGRVRDLVLTRYMVQSLSRAKTDPIDITYYWRRSLTTAVIASRLAAAQNSRRREEIFIGGLLADVGVIVLTQALPSKYGPAAQCYKPLGGDGWMQQEQSILNIEHGEVSAMVLEAWSLPELLVEGVRAHHGPYDSLDAANGSLEVARLIGAAGNIAPVLCEAADPAKAAAVCVEAMGRVNLDPGVLIQLLPSVQSDVESLADTLKLDVVPARAYKLIAEQIGKKLLTPVG